MARAKNELNNLTKHVLWKETPRATHCSLIRPNSVPKHQQRPRAAEKTETFNSSR